MVILSLFDRKANKVGVVFKHKNKRSNGRRTSAMDIDICIGRSSRYLERKCDEKDLEAGILEFETVGEFLGEIKKEF